MDLNDIVLATTAVASICLGIAVYQRTPDRAWNRLYALHAIAVGLWTFLNYLIMTADNASDAGLWLRLSHPIVAIVICTCVDFAWSFPEQIEYADSARRAILYAIGLFFGTVASAPNLYHSIEVSAHVVSVEYGWPFAAFGVFTVVALGYADLIMVQKLRAFRGVQRVQVAYVLIGLVVSQTIAVITMIIVPLTWGSTAYSGWGTAGYIITILAMGYAIAKHRLMRPEVALRRVATYALAAGLVLGTSAGALRMISPYVQGQRTPVVTAFTLAGLIMGVIMVAVYERLKDTLDRIFSADRQHAAAQSDTSRDILRTLDVNQLLHLVAKSVYEALDPLHVVVYVKDPETGTYQPRAFEPKQAWGERALAPAPIAADNFVVRAVADDGSILSRDHVLRFHSLAEARPLAAEMAKLRAHLVAPMVWEDELIGLVIVGAARSDDMYSSEDLRYLSQLTPQVSLALQNAELYAQTARLKDFNESILQEMDNAVVVVDGSERVVVFNPAAERLFGIPAAQAIGQSLAILPEALADCIHSSLSSGELQHRPQIEIVRDDGSHVPLACSASPIGSGSDQAGAVAVVSDLSLMQELERERQEAERLALIRRISAGMAHEIRNPLVAIRTFAELAPKRLHDPDFRSNFLTVAQQEINRIDKLVSDLLTLSKPADAVVEPMDIKLICERVLRSTSARTEANNLSIHMQAEELHGEPKGDPSRIEQALMNLVTNAIEAEPEGGEIGITIERATDDAGKPVVRVRVHNPGSYIAAEHIKEIFRPFYSDKPKGTGLGLAISQTIVEEHGGRLSVVSTEEAGTEFIVELPLQQAKVATSTAGERQL